MSPRRRVAMPEPGWSPPSRIDASGLKVTVTDEGTANSIVIDLTDLPGTRELRNGFARAIETITGPTGTWKRTATTRRVREALPSFLEFLDEVEVTSISGVTPRVWNDFRLHLASASRPVRANRKKSAPFSVGMQVQVLSCMKQLLRSAPELPQATKQALNTRLAKVERRVQQHYTEKEFEEIQRLAQTVVHAAAQRIGANDRLLGRYGDPTLTPEEERKAEALRVVMTSGGLDVSKYADMPLFKALGAIKVTRYERPPGSGRFHNITSPRLNLARAALFMTPAEAAACAVLLMCHEGYNRSVIDNMTVPDRAATAANDVDAYRTPTDKARRGRTARHQTDILVDEGSESVGRAIRWITTATEPARRYLAEHGEPTNRLLASWTTNGPKPTLGIPTSARLAAKKWWPANIADVAHWAMLHRTHVTRIERRPEHHNQNTFYKEYLLLDTAQRQIADRTIVEGLNAALAPATKRLALRIIPSDDQVSVDGDTAVVSCADYNHNPRTGVRCLDSFLMCLECENGLAAPRHVKRIVVLHDAMENLKSAIDPDIWEERYERYFLDLIALLRSDKFTEAQIREARAAATDEDRHIIESLLRGEYDR